MEQYLISRYISESSLDSVYVFIEQQIVINIFFTAKYEAEKIYS